MRQAVSRPTNAAPRNSRPGVPSFSARAKAAGITATVGWPIYFCIAGVSVSIMCVGMWAVFNRVEQLVEARALDEQRASQVTTEGLSA